MLVNMNQMLAMAKEKHFAVGAFNVSESNLFRTVVEAAEGEVEEEDEDTDAKQAIAESAAASGAGESTLPVAGPAPISHAEGKVPVSKRPKSEELKTPWADGRTFPGTGKNAPCPCGSGRKYKMCHGQNEK